MTPQKDCHLTGQRDIEALFDRNKYCRSFHKDPVMTMSDDRVYFLFPDATLSAMRKEAVISFQRA